MIASVLLFAIILIRRVRLPATSADWRLLAWTGFLTITVNYALVFWGEQFLASGLAALLNATIPLFGLPLAHRYIASERLTARKVMGVLLGLGGVGVVCSAELGEMERTPSGLVSRSSWLLSPGRRERAREGAWRSPRPRAPRRCADGDGMPAVAGGGILLEGNPAGYHWTAMAVMALAYLAVVGSVVAFLAYYWLIRHIEVTRVLLIPLVTPLVAVLLGMGLLGETIGWGTAAGGSAILVGVGLVVFGR